MNDLKIRFDHRALNRHIIALLHGLLLLIACTLQSAVAEQASTIRDGFAVQALNSAVR